jgi:hypothetical protein
VIGSPLPDPRIRISQDLSTQIDRFFAAGKLVEVVPIGVSGESIGGQSMAAHHAKLRADRDKEAPTLRYLAEQGYNVKQAAEAMGTGEKRVRLMASENGISIGQRL